MNEPRRSWMISGLIESEADLALVDSTLQALVQADLEPVVDVVVGRVIGADHDDARADRLVDETGRLQPFVDLLLRELQAIATAPGWSPRMRTARAFSAVEDAGF